MVRAVYWRLRGPAGGALCDVVSSINIENSGYAFILSAENRFVAHPRDDWIFKESLHSLAGVAKRLGQGDFDDITMLALKFVGKT